MILYFSGTGNSAHAARRIAGALGDEATDLFEKIRGRDCSRMHSDRPWVVVTPTYAWRIPRVVQAWLQKTELTGSREMYFVMTCGGNIGDAGRYLRALCAAKGLRYRGCAEIRMPENYVALFATPSPAEALPLVRQADRAIDEAARRMKGGEALCAPAPTWRDRLRSGPVNAAFYPAFVHAGRFYATDACVSCGKCAAVCPLGNVRLEAGRPVWGKDCTHCMACICRCPTEAIEYGKHSRGLPRYVCPEPGEE